MSSAVEGKPGGAGEGVPALPEPCPGLGMPRPPGISGGTRAVRGEGELSSS